MGLVAGCGGPAGPARTPVTGTVTLDGQPLKQGEIRFDPVDGKGPSDGAPIKDGAFTIQATAGEKKVVIVSTQESPIKLQGDLPNFVDVIPPDFGGKTKQRVTVPHKEPLKYEIKSVPAKKS